MPDVHQGWRRTRRLHLRLVRVGAIRDFDGGDPARGVLRFVIVVFAVGVLAGISAWRSARRRASRGNEYTAGDAAIARKHSTQTRRLHPRAPLTSHAGHAHLYPRCDTSAAA